MKRLGVGGVGLGLTLGFVVACGSSRWSDDGWGPPSGGGPNPPTQTDPGPNMLRPQLGETTIPPVRAPAIFGGTLLVTDDGHYAVAADPDRDQIYVVDLVAKQISVTIPTGAGSLPFRGIESAPGVVHFTLRGTGAVVSIDLASGSVLWTAHACVEPRGIAFDPTRKTLAIACERGDIVSLDVANGAMASSLHVDVTSLRDVFVEGDGFWVSDFRDARLLHVDAQGTIVSTLGTIGLANDFAWRTRRIGPKTFIMSHQSTAPSAPLRTGSVGAYGGSSCERTGSAVTSRVSVLDVDFVGETYEVPSSTLPVDVAYRDSLRSMMVVLAGNSWQPALHKVQNIQRGMGSTVGFECKPTLVANPPGEIVATEMTPSGAILVQSREPAALHFIDREGSAQTTIPLSSVSRADTGFVLFHANSGRGIACASCHAEGADDGQTWTFIKGTGPTKMRRTPSLRGTVRGTAPYHWDGEEPTLNALFDDVMSRRMDGPTLDASQRVAFASWIEQIPAPGKPAPTGDEGVARGADLFAAKGCASCHGANGAAPSKDAYDVGTGGDFGPPPLVGVSLRAPFMHSGCAATLAGRFNPACGGDAHGGVVDVGEASDLIAYLKTL